MELLQAGQSLQSGAILLGVFGGLALFLFGMDQMTAAMKIIAGKRMKGMLARLTSSRLKALLAGTFVTAVIQSSSITTVLIVGFVSAGLMSLPQSIGIIMGAGIGTTITAQIVAFKVTQYALVLVIAGVLLQFVSNRKKIRQYGVMILGLGLIFLGMNMMSEATYPLRSYQPFIGLMQQMSNPLLAILISALFTAIVQSSSATIGIVIVLAGQGVIPLETGIALVFGANIGTSVTALLAAIGKPREAVQTALVHLLFNLLGVVLWFALIDHLALLVRWVSPVSPGLDGMARLAAETPRQIANAHTIFNVGNAVVFIWFTGSFAKLVQWLVPKRERPGPGHLKPKYLDDILLATPDLALERVRLELIRLGRYAQVMVQKALDVVFWGTQDDLDQLSTMDDELDLLYDAIVAYLAQLSRKDLLESQTGQLARYMTAANDIENIGDMVQTNLFFAGQHRLEHEVQMSRETREVLKMLHEKVLWSIAVALAALEETDMQEAQRVIDAKAEVDTLANQAAVHLSHRLITDDPHRLILFRIESELVEYLKRVYYFAKHIARAVGDENEKSVG